MPDAKPMMRRTRTIELEVEAAVWAALEREAVREGVGVAEYVRDAALARAAFAWRVRGEGPDDLLAAWARALLDGDADDAGLGANGRRLIAELARERRDEAVALRAESQQARRQAQRVRGEKSVILDAAVRIVTDVLERRGIALGAPVVARFRAAEDASTGIEIEVRLEEAGQAEVARAAIDERVGDDSPVDVIHVR
jgi:hypothetical protein